MNDVIKNKLGGMVRKETLNVANSKVNDRSKFSI